MTKISQFKKEKEKEKFKFTLENQKFPKFSPIFSREKKNIVPKNHWIIRASFFQFCQVGGLAIIHKRKMSQFWLEVSERTRIFSGSRFFSGELIE
jgi:hypothetical protein